MTTIFPLQISTADNTAITGDTNNVTCDGANLLTGGSTVVIEESLRKSVQFSELSYTVSGFIGIPAYGPLVGKSPLPQLYPPQTFYINGAPVVI